MEADLHAIVSLPAVQRETSRIPSLIFCRVQVRSGQPLSDAHFQSFLYQTLCGLKVSGRVSWMPGHLHHHRSSRINVPFSTSTPPMCSIGISSPVTSS